MHSVNTFGVIGCGEFGQVAAKHLAPPNAAVRMFDVDPNRQMPTDVRPASLATVAASDVVVLAVPFDAYDAVLPELVSLSHPDTLVVDVCSVKIKPTQTFGDHGLLDRPNLLMTHPLFGPQTTNGSIAGKSLVVTTEGGPRAEDLLDCWQDKGINLVSMTADEHDKEMAKVHVLPFIIGRSLLEMDITGSPLATNYFGKLLALVEVERHHSPELFNTIQQHNPYAANVRSEFISTICALHAQVVVDGHHPEADPLEALEAHRATLDVIDHYSTVLLGLRFAVTGQIGELKAMAEMPSIDLDREAAQREVLKDRAEQNGVPVELAQAIQRLVINEVVSQHEALKS